MSELTNTKTALLGLLSEGPMHPYQIEQEVKYRDMRSWTDLSMSSIYKLLKDLEEDGFVERTNEISSENRLRKLYTISPEGKKVLRGKLKALLSEPEHMKWQIDIATYNSSLLSHKATRTALEQYRSTLQEKIAGYEALLKFLRDSGCPPHRFGVATRPIFLLKGDIEWVDSYLSDLGKKTTE